MSGRRPGPGVLLALLAGAALSSACTASPPLPPGDTREPGRLVIVGGALASGNRPVYQAVLEGLHGPGPLCILPTASGDPRAAMASAVERFETWSAAPEVRGVLLTVDNAGEARSEAMATTLRSCAGYFFTGGSQSRILDVFRPGGEDTAAYTAIVDRWREGAVVAGTSAGAAMMSRRSINGGSSPGALLYGIRTTEDGDGVWVRDGMDFTGDFVVDQHFLARGRWGRLAVAVLRDSLVRAGAGIDENTALVVDGDTGRVLGASGVVWMQQTDEPGTLRMDLLGRGDRIDLVDGSPARATDRTTLPGGPTVDPPTDPFDRWVLLHLLDAFGRSPEPTLVLEAGPETGGAVLVLEKLPDFSATRTGGTGADGATPGLSLGPVRLEITAPAVR